MKTRTTYICRYCDAEFRTKDSCSKHEERCAKLVEAIECELVVTDLGSGRFYVSAGKVARVAALDVGVVRVLALSNTLRFYSKLAVGLSEAERERVLLGKALDWLERQTVIMKDKLSKLSAAKASDDCWITPAGNAVEKIKVKRVAKRRKANE